jgi:3-oxoacyl-[acyl-carrier-protein] synthase II
MTKFMKRRVVVTGLGLVTANGNDVPTTWESLKRGESGADIIQKFDVENFPVKFACEVKNFNVEDFLDKKEARRMGAFSHFAIAASDEAVKDSGLVIDESNAEMVGTYIGQSFAVLYRFGDC